MKYRGTHIELAPRSSWRTSRISLQRETKDTVSYFLVLQIVPILYEASTSFFFFPRIFEVFWVFEDAPHSIRKSEKRNQGEIYPIHGILKSWIRFDHLWSDSRCYWRVREEAFKIAKYASTLIARNISFSSNAPKSDTLFQQSQLVSLLKK